MRYKICKSIFTVALAVIFLAPVAASAQNAEICNAYVSLKGLVNDAGEVGQVQVFEGDRVTLRAELGAGEIIDTELKSIPYIDFTGIGYGIDCGGGPMNALGECTAVGHGIIWEGVSDTSCRTETGDPAFRINESDNIVEVPVINGTLRHRAIPGSKVGTTCTIDLDFTIDSMHESTNRITQAVGLPYQNMEGTCSNDLMASAYAKGSFAVETCDIDVIKEVSKDQEEWFDAKTEEAALLVGEAETLYYRVKVLNKGTAPLVGDVRVTDGELGIDEGFAPDGEGIIELGSFDIAKKCEELFDQGETLFTNEASVEGFCRLEGGGFSAVSDTATDIANVLCPTPEPQIELTASEFCVNDAPWVEYSFDVFGIPGFQPSDVTYTWINVSDTPGTEIVVQEPLPFTAKSGYLLWPGASYIGDPPTNPPIGGIDPDWPVGDGWPGWTLNPDGSWTEFDTPETPELVLRVTINPTAEEFLIYPPRTEDCAAAPKPQLEVVKSIDKVTYNEDGTLDVTYSATVENTGGQDAEYDLRDILKVDEALVPLSVVSDVEYVAGSEDDQDGTLGMLEPEDFPGPVTLVSGESLAYGEDEGFRFTLRFAFDGALTSVEGANCLVDDDEESNTGLTNRVEVFIGESLEDFDEVCDPFKLDPKIEILKEISIDGETFYDVSAGPVVVGSGAIYRLTVRNLGNIAFSTVTVTDPLLQGLAGDAEAYTFGPLAALGEPGDEFVIDIAKWPVLDASKVALCEEPGDDPLNTATAEGDWGDPQGGTVKDSDDATLICEGVPKIELVKRVGLPDGEGGWNMADANDEPPAFPLVVAEYDELNQVWTSSDVVKYEFEVTNTSFVALTDVVITDPTLLGGIEIQVGDLAVGESKLIESGFIDINHPNGIDLTNPNVCESGVGVMNNVASASGTSVVGPSNVSMDQANVRCVGKPSIKIEKFVSTDGDTYTEAVSTEPVDDAYWKIVVTNDGYVDLTNVVVKDEAEGGNLDPLVPAFDLAVGETVTFVYLSDGSEVNPVEVTELYEAGFCASPFPYANPYINTATVTGDADSAWLNESVSAFDTASYDCEERVFWCDANGGNDKPNNIWFRYTGALDDNHQGASIATPDPALSVPASVFVEIYNDSNIPPNSAKQVAELTVALNGEFLLDPAWAQGGSGKVQPNTVFLIYDQDGGTLLQSVFLHTSCSEPLWIGDQFGVMKIVDINRPEAAAASSIILLKDELNGNGKKGKGGK